MGVRPTLKMDPPLAATVGKDTEAEGPTCPSHAAPLYRLTEGKTNT